MISGIMSGHLDEIKFDSKIPYKPCFSLWTGGTKAGGYRRFRAACWYKSAQQLCLRDYCLRAPIEDCPFTVPQFIRQFYAM